MADETRSTRTEASCTVRVARLPRDGERIEWTLGEAPRAALAKRLGIVAVDRFAADVVAAPWRRDGVSVRGRLTAEVVQQSVVTLESVMQSIAKPVDLTFVPDTSQLAKPLRDEPVELEIDPEGEDPPEVFTGDAIDLGAALEELLALALDPYPRAGGESFEDRLAPDAEEPTDKVSPFAALSRLKPGETDG